MVQVLATYDIIGMSNGDMNGIFFEKGNLNENEIDKAYHFEYFELMQ